MSEQGVRQSRGEEAQLLVYVLNAPDYLDDVLAAFLEANITAATVLESQGIGGLLSRDMPIFASFRHLLTGSRPYSYTIVAPVIDGEAVEEVIALLRDVLAEAAPEDRGFLVSVPIAGFVNLADEDE
jgi:nitrogen regulatory protein P-II 1